MYERLEPDGPPNERPPPPGLGICGAEGNWAGITSASHAIKQNTQKIRIQIAGRQCAGRQGTIKIPPR